MRYGGDFQRLHERDDVITLMANRRCASVFMCFKEFFHFNRHNHVNKHSLGVLNIFLRGNVSEIKKCENCYPRKIVRKQDFRRPK